MKVAGSYIILALLATSFLSSSAQLTCSVELSLALDQFRIVTSEESISRVEAMDYHYYYSENAQNPALPLRSISILVPNGAELADFSYTMQEKVVGEDISLGLVSLPVSVGSVPEKQLPGASFQGSFPDRVLNYSSTLVQRGYTWFSFTFSPFRYDAESRDLTLIQNMELEVTYILNKNKASVVRPDRATVESLKRRLMNAGDMNQLYPSRQISAEKASGIPIDYLIITTEMLVPAFEPLLEWKIRKGLNAEIVTLDEIYESNNEATNQLKIKRYLYNRYISGGLKWVLMGGDHDIVPVQGCYSYVLNGSIEVTDESIPTDLFYACFDKRFDWNALQDQRIGQVYHDDNDLVPEIYLSRVPVRNLQQVSDFVNKTLNYEKHHPARGFSDKMLLAGVKTWTLWSGKSDSQHRSELMFENYISDFWDGDMIRFFDTGTDFSGDRDYQLTASNLSDQLNSGFGYFHYSGHGDIHTFLMEEGSRFGVEDAQELSNSSSGIIFSNACDVNAFDSIDPCLSEAFLRNPNGGGVAFFGSSRLGFGLPDISYTLGPSFQYNASFFSYLFSGSGESGWNSFAGIASAAKTDYAEVGSSGGTYLYLLYAINPMGDPELPLYTRNPSSFDNVRLYLLGEDLTVNTGGVSGGRICVTSLELGEGYKAVVEDVSNFTFKGVPGAFQVTITAPNYQPYIYRFSSRTDVHNDMESHVRIYPNPVQSKLNLDFDLFEGKLFLYDIRGSLLGEQILVNGSNSIPMDAFPAGSYLVNVRSNNSSGWFKIVRSSD